VHAAPRFVRSRPDRDPEWREAPEGASDVPMTLLNMENGERREMWPDGSCLGLPVLLPGGERGRLLGLEHDEDSDGWTYTLDFRGNREP
jgi:hypothetical protein